MANNVLPNAVECLKSLLEGTAEIKMVPDALSETGAEKMVAVYDNVQITYMGGGYQQTPLDMVFIQISFHYTLVEQFNV